jgi:hypothetical protein
MFPETLFNQKPSFHGAVQASGWFFAVFLRGNFVTTKRFTEHIFEAKYSESWCSSGLWRAPSQGKCIERLGSFDWVLDNLRLLGGFAVCERDCYCAVFCCHVRVQFLLEKRLDYLEKPARNKEAYAPVLVDALAFEVMFL